MHHPVYLSLLSLCLATPSSHNVTVLQIILSESKPSFLCHFCFYSVCMYINMSFHFLFSVNILLDVQMHTGNGKELKCSIVLHMNVSAE